MSIHDILQKYWGYASFRSLQTEIIESVLEGYDTLALLPTGGGKSLCFQVPAMAVEGMCLVVSPLIALMKDQVEQLQKRGIAAAALFTGMHSKAVELILREAEQGKIKFLYVSPERLQTTLFRARAPLLPIQLLAIDEAHCISQWGYDFRPQYLQIADFKAKYLPNETLMIALTATATDEVKKDIQEKLLFRNDKTRVFQKSFARANLSYSVFEEENKHRKLLKILQSVNSGSAVVYVQSRKNAQETAAFLKENRISADYYHAGLTQAQRNAKQSAWIKNQIRVIVATNAFGMGIDKPDVRVVVHMELPNTLEAYYQEAGRAGRDEKKAYAVALYNGTDITHLKQRIEQAYPPLEHIKRVYQALANYYQLSVGAGEMVNYEFEMATFLKNFQLESLPTYHALKRLEENALLQFNESFWQPSQVNILISYRDFYDFQMRNPHLDAFCKILLRLYGQGIFTKFVNIQEANLAQALKTKTQEVIKQLEILQNLQIIAYQRPTDKPQITWLTPRLEVQNLPIDTARMEALKKRDLQKLMALINYATQNKNCRTKILLDYFGEEDYELCGVCDVCLEKKKQTNPEKEKILAEKIIEILAEKQLSIAELVNIFEHKEEKLIIAILRQWLDEGKITQTEEAKLFYKQKKDTP
ncbi:MAG: RecQ family ATP-dependent DNA helicase [Cytophagales bacterium]|nr:MAG: RecQ family ATP-dependent DNA helicase [Cytophagales bacterium]